MEKKEVKTTCEVCKALGVDSYLLNGPERNKIMVCTFYRVLKNKPLKVKLCTFHDIELFQLGESNFLKQNIEYALELRARFGKEL